MANITGTGGNNTLRGTSAEDVLYGLAGNESLTGSGRADALYGGTGNDTLNMDAADTLNTATFSDVVSRRNALEECRSLAVPSRANGR